MNTPDWIQSAISQCIGTGREPNESNIVYSAMDMYCENIGEAADFMCEHAAEFVQWQAQQEGGKP